MAPPSPDPRSPDLGKLIRLMVLAVASSADPARAADGFPLFSWPVDGPSRGAPTVISSWRVSVLRADTDVRSAAVAAADPAWTARVKFSKVPFLAANPIPRTAPHADDPITGHRHALEGLASFYWQEQMTATGERFDKLAMTAAHRTLPLNTRVRVTNAVNGRSVVVRINDRGPFKPGRIIDLSEAAATALDMTKAGLVPVRLQVISN